MASSPSCAFAPFLFFLTLAFFLEKPAFIAAAAAAGGESRTEGDLSAAGW
jgi:hypothetical protein